MQKMLLIPPPIPSQCTGRQEWAACTVSGCVYVQIQASAESGAEHMVPRWHQGQYKSRIGHGSCLQKFLSPMRHEILEKETEHKE